MLTSNESHTLHPASYLIWHRQVPANVTILAWRLLRNRLPTKDNLVVHDIISHDAQLCVNGCGKAETAQHLFITYNKFQDLWYLVRDCIGVFTSEPFCISDHFVQFSHSIGGFLAQRSFMQLICLTCVWVSWPERNNHLFNHKDNLIDQLLHNVKIHSYW